jgi:catechol 2,3-dioxygenase-like lactoylglutathione lyase family enzyme
MKMARVILFTGRMDAMSKFYGEVLGLRQVTDEKGWREFSAGGARIALHSGPSSPGRKGPKIVFHSEDVAALREKLVERAQVSARSDRGSFVSATAKTRTAIPFNCPTAEIQEESHEPI